MIALVVRKEIMGVVAVVRETGVVVGIRWAIKCAFGRWGC
jgi:hypothetical protein